MLQTGINWFTGLFLILGGLYHNLVGGPMVGRWLDITNPPISARSAIIGRLGFEMGGYLAIAIGLTFILFGNSLPKSYHLFWALAFFMVAGISLYTFRSFHVSQLLWLLSVLLGLYYLYAT